MLTLGEVQAAMPATMKKMADQHLVDTVNNIASDPLVAEQIRDNFMSYTGVMKDGRYRTDEYLSAIMYISFKLLGDTNKEAWAKTFPQRYALLKGRGAAEKEISAHVTAYGKTKLVNAIFEQSQIPVWLLNAHIYQKAINVQADLMKNASSEKVRTDAANSLLTHLKRPEAIKGQLDINVKDSSGLNELKTVLGELAKEQLRHLQSGTPIKQITDATIIENGAQ